jgi:hypothetical protein
MTTTLRTTLCLISLVAAVVCHGQDGRTQGQILKNKIDSVLENYKKPASKDGVFLEATVDGTKWAADWMYVDPDPSKTFDVNGHKGDVSVIDFSIGKSVVKSKGTKNFTELSGVQMMDDNHDMFDGSEGAYQITNVTDTWIEGTFHVTVKNVKTGKMHQISDGHFRVKLPEKWKAD